MAKRGRKKKPGRKPMLVKIKGDPFALIDRMLGRDGSSPTPPPRKSARRKSG